MDNLSVGYKAKSLATPNFMIALVHEVKNPLSNINVSLVMLKSPLEEVDKKGYLNIIKHSAMHINTTVDQLLSNQGLEEVALKSQSIHQLVDRVLALAADSIELKKVKVIRNYTVNGYELLVDTSKLIVALGNIVINAINAMTYGKGELVISTKVVNGNLQMLLKDNGFGISNTTLKHIFKPNFSSKPNVLGMDLKVAYNIVKINNISIDVTSTVGIGAGFTLLFKSIGVVK